LVMGVRCADQVHNLLGAGWLSPRLFVSVSSLVCVLGRSVTGYAIAMDGRIR